MDFPRIRSTFGVTPYAPGRRRPLERDEEDTIADIPNPEMMQKEPEIYDRPFPPGVAAQEAFDDMLQRRIVDPLAKAGFEDMGAGLAAVPSAAHSMIVPQSEFDVAGTVIPLPGVAKLMKKGKFRKISKAMHVEDPEHAAEIIAKQASKEVPPSTAVEGPKAEVRAIDEKEMLRKADESNAREAAEAPKPRSWTDIRPEKTYELDGRIMSGKKLKDELLQMSTGDFHTAKWNEVTSSDGSKAKKALDKRLRESELEELDKEIDAINDELDELNPSDPDYNIMVDQRTARLEEIEKRVDESLKAHQRERLKVVDPPKGPKGDPEASLPRQPDKFSSIRSQMDVAPARMDERGKAFGDVGQSEFTPYNRPNVISEDVPRKNYVESEMDPVEQTITKILSDPKLQNVSPEQKQALANFVRYRYERNKGITNEYAFEKMLGLKDDPRSITGLSGPESKIADYDMLRKMHANEALDAQLDEYSSGWKAYNDLDKYFGRDQAIMSKRHPAVNRMMNALSEDQPFGRADTIFDQSKDLQDKMYAGRPSHEAEQAKLFPKVKEAVIGPKKEEAQAKVRSGWFKTKDHYAKGTVLENDGEMYKVTGKVGDKYTFDVIPYDEKLSTDETLGPWIDEFYLDEDFIYDD